MVVTIVNIKLQNKSEHSLESPIVEGGWALQFQERVQSMCNQKMLQEQTPVGTLSFKCTTNDDGELKGSIVVRIFLEFHNVISELDFNFVGQREGSYSGQQGEGRNAINWDVGNTPPPTLIQVDGH